MITRNRSGHRFDLCDKIGSYSIDNYVFGVNQKYDYNRKKDSTDLKGNLYGVSNKLFGPRIRCLILVIFLWRNRNFRKK